MLDDRTLFAGQADGRLVFRRNLKDWKASAFIVDFGSGKNSETGENIARLETKVICREAGVPKFAKSHSKFISDVNNWLEFAHGITSPFFKDFVLPDVMSKFEQE
jgi:hypothetical protein